MGNAVGAEGMERRQRWGLAAAAPARRLEKGLDTRTQGQRFIRAMGGNGAGGGYRSIGRGRGQGEGAWSRGGGRGRAHVQRFVVGGVAPIERVGDGDQRPLGAGPGGAGPRLPPRAGRPRLCLLLLILLAQVGLEGAGRV